MLQVLLQQRLLFVGRVSRHADLHVIAVAVQHVLNPRNDVHEHHVAQRRDQRHDSLRTRRRQCAGWFAQPQRPGAGPDPGQPDRLRARQWQPFRGRRLQGWQR
ncbi:hypothetical protein G6F31_019757 [Rhizopus arrhizus]|nr:hypothetical protein G6F31_019757 [Rhizopus arrhizus]